MKLGNIVVITVSHPDGSSINVKGHVEVVMDYNEGIESYLLSDGFWYAYGEFRLATINEIRKAFKKLKGAE